MGHEVGFQSRHDVNPSPIIRRPGGRHQAPDRRSQFERRGGHDRQLRVSVASRPGLHLLCGRDFLLSLLVYVFLDERRRSDPAGDDARSGHLCAVHPEFAARERSVSPAAADRQLRHRGGLHRLCARRLRVHEHGILRTRHIACRSLGSARSLDGRSDGTAGSGILAQASHAAVLS